MKYKVVQFKFFLTMYVVWQQYDNEMLSWYECKRKRRFTENWFLTSFYIIPFCKTKQIVTLVFSVLSKNIFVQKSGNFYCSHKLVFRSDWIRWNVKCFSTIWSKTISIQQSQNVKRFSWKCWLAILSFMGANLYFTLY